MSGLEEYFGEIRKSLRSLEAGLDLGSDFYEMLRNSPTDWVFVVSANTLLEACATDLLCARVPQRLTERMARLKYATRIDWLDDLEALPYGALEFLRKFNEKRNQLAHSPHALRYRFADVPNKTQQHEWASCWALETKPAKGVKPPRLPNDEVFLSDPRLVWYWGVLHVAALCHGAERDLRGAT